MNVSGIPPISTQPIIRPPGQGVSPPGGDGADFGKLLRGALDKVNAGQADSAAAVERLLTGRSEDVLPVVAAVAKADIRFKLLIGVRNKVIEAYKQTMNMQV